MNIPMLVQAQYEHARELSPKVDQVLPMAHMVGKDQNILVGLAMEPGTKDNAVEALKILIRKHQVTEICTLMESWLSNVKTKAEHQLLCRQYGLVISNWPPDEKIDCMMIIYENGEGVRQFMAEIKSDRHLGKLVEWDVDDIGGRFVGLLKKAHMRGREN